MQVKHLMSCGPPTCHEDDSLDIAIGTMWRQNCGALPVVDGDNALVGILTDRDVCIAAYCDGLELDQMSVGEVARRTVYSVDPRDSLQRAEQLMRTHRIRRLPVVDGERLVGMISLTDMAQEAVREHKGNEREISCDEIVETLAAIGRNG